MAEKAEFGIDDITWNDLDMDIFFREFNNTCSQNGGEYLYDMLRRPLITEEGQGLLKERGRVSDLFKNDHELRDKYIAAFENREEIKDARFREKIDSLFNVREDSSLIHITALLLGIISLVFIFIYPPAGFVLFIIASLFNVSSYFKRKGEIEGYIPIIRNLIRELRDSRGFLKLDSSGLESYNLRLREISGSLRKIESNSWIVIWGKRLTGGLMDLPLDFIRIFLHPDLIKFNSIIRTIKEKEGDVRELFEITGFLDAMISLSIYKEKLKYYSEPVFKTEGGIEIKGGYHPLLKDPVPYDIDNVSLMLLTGSNASGKSTFLKSVALAVILSETAFTVPADSISLVPVDVLSSMSLRDNIITGDSLYITEIKSVKRIVEKLKESTRIAVFLDEVLKGTNTVERIASLSVLLKNLSPACLCFAATHDTPLTEILDDIYDNYHFEENVTDDGITFPYELTKGRTGSKDAIRLLSVMGFSGDITEKAFSLAEKYEKEGVWEKL